MDEPLISVIVPAYNCEKYIAKCLASILNQTYKNIEIIVVDDGSTDNTYSLCEDIQKNNPSRMKLFHQSNKGQSVARNFGIKHASGDYIGFVDSDDWIDEKMYQTLFDNLVNNKSQISCCSVQLVSEEGKTRGFSNANCTELKIYDTKSALSALIDNAKITSSPCDKLYEAKIVKNNLMIEGIIFEDYEVMTRWISSATTIVYTSSRFYFYRDNPLGTMHDVSERKLDQVFSSETRTKFIIENYPELKEKAIFKDFENSINILAATYLLKGSEKRRELRKKVLAKSKRTSVKMLSFKNKVEFYVLKMGLSLFDFVAKVYEALKKKRFKDCFNA